MSVHFPNEIEASKNVRKELRDYFNFAEQLIFFWSKQNHKKAFTTTPKVPRKSCNIAFSMSVRLARQFKTVLELCQRCEDVDAAIISRSMFETVLIIEYVLRPRFIPRKEFKTRDYVITTQQGKKTVKRWSGIKLELHGKKMTREFRADLFHAHEIFYYERLRIKNSGRPGNKRVAKKKIKFENTKKLETLFEKRIGPEWTEIMKKNPNYAGIQIIDLAQSLGKPFSTWCFWIYSFQSQHVHSEDFNSFVIPQNDGGVIAKWLGNVSETYNSLICAISMFHKGISTISRYLNYESTTQTSLRDLSRAFQALTK